MRLQEISPWSMRVAGCTVAVGAGTLGINELSTTTRNVGAPITSVSRTSIPRYPSTLRHPCDF